MIKLSKRVVDKLPRIPRTKPKTQTAMQDMAYQTRVRKKRSWSARHSEPVFQHNPKDDVFVRSPKTESVKKDTKTHIGDFLVEKNRVLAEKYKDDLEIMAIQIPEVTFFRDANNTSYKELKSILDKIKKRDKQFKERGYKGVIRDGVRATIFMPDANKNYMKSVEWMEKKGYKIAKNFAEDKEGNLILDAKGKPKMIDDIDVRFGENACASGYEDVQIRFQKGDVLYELLILPGPHYMSAKNREHELVYDQFKKYKALGFEKDAGAKSIISAINARFMALTKTWYAEALLKDKKGAGVATEPKTFSKEDIKDLNDLFKSLKNLYLGRFKSLPPSKRTKADFKDTKTFQNLHDVETNLRKVMEMYKPAEQ